MDIRLLPATIRSLPFCGTHRSIDVIALSRNCTTVPDTPSAVLEEVITARYTGAPGGQSMHADAPSSINTASSRAGTMEETCAFLQGKDFRLEVAPASGRA